MRQVMSRYPGRMALVLALGVITAAAQTTAAAGGGKKTETKVTAKADKPGPDGKQTVVVTLEVNPGWYAYANPVGLEDFKDNATVIKVSAKEKPENVKVAYPPGKIKEDKVLGNYNIYE